MLKKLLDEALLVKLDVLIVASRRLSHARFFFFVAKMMDLYHHKN
jgi:hypothetical protein